MRKGTKFFLFVIAALAFYYLFFVNDTGGIPGIPGITQPSTPKFKYSCNVVIDNLPIVDPWISSESCVKERVSSCFSFFSIFGESGNLKVCAGTECKSTNYDVGNVIGNRVSKDLQVCTSDVNKITAILYDASGKQISIKEVSV